MSKWHREILVDGQVDLLPALKPFAKDFGLVGGTAIALHVGHRESIDFDLFSKEPDTDFNIPALKRRFKRYAGIDTVIRDKARMRKRGFRISLMRQSSTRVILHKHENLSSDRLIEIRYRMGRGFSFPAHTVPAAEF